MRVGKRDSRVKVGVKVMERKMVWLRVRVKDGDQTVNFYIKEENLTHVKWCLFPSKRHSLSSIRDLSIGYIDSEHHAADH